MAATLLDGKELATKMQAEIAAAVAVLADRSGIRPGLAAVIVGENPASQGYVRNKRKACAKVGMESWFHELPADCSQQRLLDLISHLNADKAVDGILVQLPLPPQIYESAVILAVTPLKDVDGFHPENYGLLAAGHPRYVLTPRSPSATAAAGNLPT